MVHLKAAVIAIPTVAPRVATVLQAFLVVVTALAEATGKDARSDSENGSEEINMLDV